MNVAGRYRVSMRRRGLAASTVYKRSCELRAWLEHVDGCWESATRADVEAWLDARELGPKATATAVSNLAAFYRWAQREGLTSTDPTTLVERPRLPMRLPRPARRGEVEAAVEMAEPWLRRALLLMVDAGLRCCEVARLEWDDVDLAAGVLLVRSGKGGRDRVVGIPARLALELLPAMCGARGPVIERRLTACRVSQLVCAHLRASGSRATAHQLRHLYATRLLEQAGGNLLAVQQALGHASVTSTQIYAQVSPSIALAASRDLV